MTDAYPVKAYKLHSPSLEEVSSLFKKDLTKHFREVECEVAECPDLTQSPYSLAASGIGGSPVLVDVGGEGNLFPTPKFEKPAYSIAKLSTLLNHTTPLFIGAADGPFRSTGCNCELAPNVMVDKTRQNNSDQPEYISRSHIVKLSDKSPGYQVSAIPHNDEFNFLGQFFVSEGRNSPVIVLRVKGRLGKCTLIETLKDVLHTKYRDDLVSMGGVFVVKSGKAKLQIIPEFPPYPLDTMDKKIAWFTRFEMDAPLTCLGVFNSCDPGYELRMDHFHCFSAHGQGGHFLYDTSADEVEYECYFNVAEYLYRVDPAHN